MCTHKNRNGEYIYYIKEAGEPESGSFEAICKRCGAVISDVVDDTD